jgi:hypothetical protein
MRKHTTSVNWNEVPDLLTRPALELAIEYNVTTSTIYNARKRLANGDTKFRPRTNWDNVPELLDMTTTDAELAEALGVQRTAVTMARLARGGKAFRGKHKPEVSIPSK